MKQEPRNDRKQEQIEQHSLPGMNQAGKGPDTCDDKPAANRADKDEHAPDSKEEPRPARR